MDTSLASILTGAGACGVFCVLFIIGWIFPKSVVTDLKAEITELKAENGALRERADTATSTASATRDILAAIQLGQHLGPAQEHP